jgi:hypothetical protein
MSKVVYNNLSAEFKKKVGWGVPLGRDEVIEFQLINIPLVKQNGEWLPFYSPTRLPNIDAVLDPHAEGGPTMVQIAYVLSEIKNTEKDPTSGLGEIQFTRANKGVITITGREPGKIGLLNYLRACNYNASNPLAQPSPYGFIFKELEPVKTAKQKLKERVDLSNCVTYISEMKDPEVVSMLKALKLPTFSSGDENMSYLVEFVQKNENRARFNSLSKDARMPVAALISMAMERELIRYEKDPMTWNYVATGKMITQVPPQTDSTEHLLEYFHNNTNGIAFKNFLATELDLIKAGESKKSAEVDLEKKEKAVKDKK